MSCTFKVGDYGCYDTDEGEIVQFGPIEFVGTGKASASYLGHKSRYREKHDLVLCWDEGVYKTWMPADQCRKLTKLEKALK